MVKEKRWNGRIVLVAAVLSLGLAVAPRVWAGFDTSGSHYPHGASDFMAGALPPPGYYLINYLTLIQKERLHGVLPGIKETAKAPVDLKADVVAEVPRFIWVSPWSILGASYGAQLFFPTYSADVKMTVDTPTGKRALIDDQDKGVGDIIVAPLILGWHFGPDLHVVFAEDIFVPTGDYDNEKTASQILSRNHWTFETVLAATYLVKGVDLSVKLMYDVNTKNTEYMPLGATDDVELKPGQEFHVDWGLGYYLTPAFEAGLSGYYYWQVTDDKIDGEKTDQKGRLAAVGPTFRYWPDKGKWIVTVKHLWEFDAKNMPEGKNTWLNATYLF